MSGLYLASRAKFRHSETENRFRALVESLLDTIFVLKDEKVVYINPAGVKMLRAEQTTEPVKKKCHYGKAPRASVKAVAARQRGWADSGHRERIVSALAGVAGENEQRGAGRSHSRRAVAQSVGAAQPCSGLR